MTDDKRQLIRAFDECMAAFPTGRGRRNSELLPRAACLAVKLGMNESAFVDAVRNVAPDMGAADVRRTYRTAGRKVAPAGDSCSAGWLRNRAKPQPPPPPPHVRHVRDLIGGMGDCGSDAVRELSPYLDWLGKPPRIQTALFMRAAFAPGEMLHVFRNDVPTAGKPGVNIRPAAEWVELVERGEPLPGDLVIPNPLTGERRETTAGTQSFIAQTCLATFPHMILEFDEMPIAKQCAFWRAFILTSNLAPALVALTFSGNRSIHGLVHVGCATLADWQAVRQRVIALFASDPDETMRADVQAMRPRTGTRLPGVRRFDNGRRQMLLYLNPRARAGNMWREPTAEPPPPIDPKGKPPCGVAHGRGMCGACECLRRCPFADPDAVPGTTMKGGESVK